LRMIWSGLCRRRVMVLSSSPQSGANGLPHRPDHYTGVTSSSPAPTSTRPSSTKAREAASAETPLRRRSSLPHALSPGNRDGTGMCTRLSKEVRVGRTVRSKPSLREPRLGRWRRPTGRVSGIDRDVDWGVGAMEAVRTQPGCSGSDGCGLFWRASRARTTRLSGISHTTATATMRRIPIQGETSESGSAAT